MKNKFIYLNEDVSRELLEIVQDSIMRGMVEDTREGREVELIIDKLTKEPKYMDDLMRVKISIEVLE